MLQLKLVEYFKEGFVMSEAPKMRLEQNFLEALINAQMEANRLETKSISDILVIKELIYMQSTHMSDLILYSGIPWQKIKTSIEKEVASWAKKTKKEAWKYVTRNINNHNIVDEKDMDFILEPEMVLVLSKASEFTFEDGLLGEVAFILALMDDPSNYVTSFLKDIRMDHDIIIRYFEGILFEKAYSRYIKEGEPEEEETKQSETSNNAQEDEKFAIPEELKGFLKVVKAEESETSPILGREEETESLTKVLLKAKKSNAILVGKPGVGKTAIVEDLAWRIKNGKCAEALKGKKVLELTVNDIVAGTVYRGMAEERFKQVSDFLEKSDDVILFVDETHTVIGAGSTGHENNHDLANALKPILAREGISVVGATTEEEYERIIKSDGAFKRRFEKIIIREPKSDEVYPMVKEQVRRLSKFHNVAITKPVVDYIIKVSGCFIFETVNPDRTLDLVDKSMATAKLKDEKVVTRETVLRNFDANFKMYAKMSEEYKLSTAYHEAGHYLVARYSKHFPLDAMAVSIIPADRYIGITVYTDEPILLNGDYDFHVEFIARLLGGRVAEKMYTGKESSGASSDLKEAKDAARSMIVEYGLSREFSYRNCDNDFYEKKMKKIDEEIDRITAEAYKVAENILKEHEEALTEIVSELLKKGILIQEDLEKICRKAESRTITITKPEEVLS